jgi:alanine dehydrogenase
MLIGIPKEIKNHEYRCALTPASVKEFLICGNQVLVQSNAGYEIGFSDEQYTNAGAVVVDSAGEIYSKSNLIFKVKEPQELECKMLQPNQIIFSYLHLAAEPQLTKMLIQANCIAIAFETVTSQDNSLPLLSPMSEIAGKLAIQAGAKCLEKSQGGRGVLLGGVPGVSKGKVLIIGGGVAGINAAKVAVGMGAEVIILDKSLVRLRYLADVFNNSITTLYASQENIAKNILDADLVIGAVLIAGATAPKLVSLDLVKKMKKGAVMVDISIDQGGCFETSRPTSHSNPTYIINDIVHYCVTNMPGAVARTVTKALENATLPFALEIANKGYKKAIQENKHLANGLNIIDGKITHKAVADSLGYQYHDAF